MIIGNAFVLMGYIGSPKKALRGIVVVVFGTLVSHFVLRATKAILMLVLFICPFSSLIPHILVCSYLSVPLRNLGDYE